MKHVRVTLHDFNDTVIEGWTENEIRDGMSLYKSPGDTHPFSIYLEVRDESSVTVTEIKDLPTGNYALIETEDMLLWYSAPDEHWYRTDGAGYSAEYVLKQFPDFRVVFEGEK